MAVVPVGGRIHPREESPKRMMGSGRIIEGINEVLQKLDHSFDIIAPVARLNTRFGPSNSPSHNMTRKLMKSYDKGVAGRLNP